MKCRLIRPMSGHPTEAFPADWQCSVCPAKGRGPRIVKCAECRSRVRQRSAVKPAGTVIDDPQAFRLVQMGVAEAIDEECDRRANRTPADLVAARHAYERTEKGIHPEDFAAYERKEMVGYTPDGDWIPGPAYTGEPDDDDFDDEDNDPD